MVVRGKVGERYIFRDDGDRRQFLLFLLLSSLAKKRIPSRTLLYGSLSFGALFTFHRIKAKTKRLLLLFCIYCCHFKGRAKVKRKTPT